MARLSWTPALSVGVDEIDRQHQEIIRRTNDLVDGMSAGSGPEQVKGLLDYLEGYIRFHFAAEQELMDRFDYPDRDEHVDEHAELVLDMARLRTQHEAAGATIGSMTQVHNRVCAWLVCHVMRTDVMLSAFLKPHLEGSGQGGS